MSAMTAERATSGFEMIVQSLGDDTTQALGRALTLWEAGVITTAEFEAMIVTLLSSFNGQARLLADSYAAAMLRELGEVPDAQAVGTLPAYINEADERERLAKAAATLIEALDDPGGIVKPLERIGASEPTSSAQQQVLATYLGNGVDGYTRGLSSNACQLCQWLYRDGHVYPSSKPFHRHPGCGCYPVPAKRDTHQEETA